MSPLPAVHLSIVQPAGYLHSLGLVDQARYLRWQLRRCGAEVTIAKNRLREDAVNIVLGAHLGFDPALRRRHACLFLNLEQLGAGGAQVSADYLRLLQTSAVADYDATNLAAYAQDAADVPLISFGHAPYLATVDTQPLAERPIQLLFFGSMNERRRRFLQRVEDCGVSVTLFDGPIYGPERDAYIRQARAVLNCSFYATSRFEQARVSHCLSLGTPVVAERNAAAQGVWKDLVSWLDDDGLADFFDQRFATPAWFAEAAAQIERFRAVDPLPDYAALLAFAAGFAQGFDTMRPRGPWRPSHLRIGPATGYRPGWLNIDRCADRAPDLVGDLGAQITLPLQLRTMQGAELLLEPGQVAQIVVGDEPARTADLETFLANALALLAVGGEMLAEVPATAGPGLRVLDEAAWRSLTDGFWRMGLVAHRFEVVELAAGSAQGRPGAVDAADAAATLRVRLVKRSATLRERMLARTHHVAFGGLDDDLQGASIELAPVLLSAPSVPVVTAGGEAPAVPSAAVADAGATRPAALAMEADAERAAALVDAGVHDEALRHIAACVSASFMKPGIAHHALYYPRFDGQIERLAGVLAARQAPATVCVTRENHLIIATELYRIGGHSKVVEEVARELTNPVLVLTDLFGHRARQPRQWDWIERHYDMAQVADLPSGTLWQRAEALHDFARRLQPRSIWYFNHHQDPVPFVATLGLPRPHKVLVHHCDHNPSLGATLGGLVHVDITDKLQQICSAHLGRETELLRLYVADRGARTFASVAGTDYSVVTAGRSGKFARGGPLALSRLVATTLATLQGRHYHVGPLDEAWSTEIAATLHGQGLDPARFVALGAVPSLWQALQQIDAAVYIGSAPVSGGRGAVEAQGCGLPVLPFTGFEPGSLLADYSSYADIALGWSDLPALAARLRTLGDRHAALSRQARAFYEEEFSRGRFTRHVQRLAQGAAEAHKVAA